MGLLVLTRRLFNVLFLCLSRLEALFVFSYNLWIFPSLLFCKRPKRTASVTLSSGLYGIPLGFSRELSTCINLRTNPPHYTLYITAVYFSNVTNLVRCAKQTISNLQFMFFSYSDIRCHIHKQHVLQ